MKKYLKYGAISILACAFFIGCGGSSDNTTSNNQNSSTVVGLKSPNQISTVDAKE